MGVLENSIDEPLRHSRGPGLWTALFIISRADGGLRFADNEPSRMVVV